MALVMNERQVPDNMWREMLTAILKKIEKAESKETYYICMALGRWRIPFELIESDIYYTLYLNICRHIGQYDLFQIS